LGNPAGIKTIIMQKDFKTAAPDSSENKSSVVWMVAGVALGLLVGLGMYHFANQHAPLFATANAAIAQNPSQLSREERIAIANTQTPNALVKKPENIPTPVTQAVKEPEKKRAIFSYHAMLPVIDVPVQPKRTDTASTKSAAQQNQAAAKRRGDFLLQVASFKSRPQAQRTAKKLSGRGVSSSVQKHSSKKGTWFRVLAGPVGKQHLAAWKQEVTSLGYKPLIRKVQ